jgi:phage gpG-like protein
VSQELHIQLDPAAQRFVAGLPGLPARALAAIARALDKANQLAVAKIQQDHLTGKGPFPVDEHRLGVVTNRLRGSLNASEAKVEGQRVTSAIGSNVVYAAIHEFGGTIHRKAQAGKVRLRVTAQGSLIRQPGHPHLAMFARGTHKRAKEVAYQADAYDIAMPERSPVRTGIQETRPKYQELISAAVIAAMQP